MKRKQKIIFLVICCLAGLLFLSTKSQAAGSITLKSSKSNVMVGEEFHISVNLSGASVATLTTRIHIDTSKIEYVSGPSNTNFSNGRILYTWTDPSGGDNPKTEGTIATFKVRAKAAGSASFQVSGDFYSPEETPVNPSFSGTNVSIKEKETTPPVTPTPPSGGTTTTPPQNNNGGGNQGISGGNAENQGSSSGSSSQTGNSNTNNNIPANNNANLKELHLDVQGLSPAFQKTVTKYNLIVDETVSQIGVNAIPEDEKASVAVSGNTNLVSGVNEIRIVVTAADQKTKKTYSIEVTKTQHPDLANAKLENLAIENIILEPEFNPDVTIYHALIGSEIENIRILAIPQIEGASVEITGADSIQFGDNTITVRVIAKDNVTDKEYTIQLYKTTQEEENNRLRQIHEEEITKEENTGISAGQIVFLVIIVGGTAGVIFMLIRKYKLEQ